MIRHSDRVFPLEHYKKLYRVLARGVMPAASADDPAVAATPCLIGQPVALGDGEGQPAAALRICAGARLVTEAWSPDAEIARKNLQRELGNVGAIVAKTEWLLAHSDGLDLAEVCGGVYSLELKSVEAGLARYPSAERIGFARLTAMAFGGMDLRPLRDQLISKVIAGTAGAGEGLDLSLITQLLGDKQAGLAIQAEVLAFHQLYRSPCSVEKPKLRVLALAAAIDGGQHADRVLLEGSGFELQTLYVVAGTELPVPLPDHDVAIVIASDSEECRDATQDRPGDAALAAAASESAAPCSEPGSRQTVWPAMWHPGPGYPGDRRHDAGAIARDGPIECWPRGFRGGAAISDHCSAARRMPASARQNRRRCHDRPISRGPPGAGIFRLPLRRLCRERRSFRKYRIVFVDGRPYACHMAVADRWDIWYLNAGMAFSESKRLEEERFMRSFDSGFARRHQGALVAWPIGSASTISPSTARKTKTVNC